MIVEPRSSTAVKRLHVAALDRYRLLQGGLLTLRAGPALILLILVIVVSLTTPVFFTSRNIGNVFSQTAVISVLALGQLLVIVIARRRPFGRRHDRALVGCRRARVPGRHRLGRARDRCDPR